MSKTRFSPAQEALMLRELIRDQFKYSLFSFARRICGYDQVNAQTHGLIIKALEHPHRKKLIVCPRGSFKSSVCIVAFSMWLLVRNPNLRILISSELYTNSKNFIREIKGHIEGDAFRKHFGDWRGNTWHESEIIVSARTKNLKEASITAGGVGTVKVGQHYDVILMDDVNSHKNSDTVDKANKVLNYYKYLISILEPNGLLAVIGTRYAQNDLIGHIIENECEIKDIDLEVPLHNKKVLLKQESKGLIL